MSGGLLEYLALASGGLSALADVSGAGGQGFNFALCLYALVAIHMRNARGILLTQVALPFTLLLDIIYCAVYTPQRPVPAIVFVCLNMFAKVAMLIYGHRFLHELGGSYSLATPVTIAGRDGTAAGAHGGISSSGSSSGSGISNTIGGGATAHPLGGAGADGSYQHMGGGSGATLDVSAFDGGGGGGGEAEKPLYSSYQGS